MAKKMLKTPLHGRWLIESMTEWDNEFINAEIRGYFEFSDDDIGSFHFGYVHGHIDYGITERDNEPAVEFTWEGNDEMDTAMGRGWAVLNQGTLEGMLYFHRGDESGFVAKKQVQ